MSKNRSQLDLVASLVFLTLGFFYFIGGFPYSLPVFAGCQALWKLFSVKRSYLFVGTMVTLLLLMAGEGLYQPHLWDMGWQSSVWFKFVLGLVWLVGVRSELCAWRAGQRSKFTPTQAH